MIMGTSGGTAERIRESDHVRGPRMIMLRPTQIIFELVRQYETNRLEWKWTGTLHFFNQRGCCACVSYLVTTSESPDTHA